MDDNFLNLFFGRTPDKSFLEDLEILKKIQEKEVLELIDRTVEWYTDDEEKFDKKWEEWVKEFSKEEIEERKKTIRILLFIFKEFVSENINKDELKEDFENLKLSQKYIDHFIEKLKPVKNEFRKNSLRSEKPYENTLISIDWEIGNKKYRDGTEKRVASIEFVYFNKGEKQIAQFDLNSKTLKHLIYRLQKIQEELC